jgi:hypothetical protein
MKAGGVFARGIKIILSAKASLVDALKESFRKAVEENMQSTLH